MEEVVVGEDRIARPKYPTKHEQMLADEREYAMEMWDRAESMGRKLEVFSRFSWIKRSARPRK